MKSEPIDFSGSQITLFYNEGNSFALLITKKCGKRGQSIMAFQKAEAALDWCRNHGATFVYLPVRLEAN